VHAKIHNTAATVSHMPTVSDAKRRDTGSRCPRVRGTGHNWTLTFWTSHFVWQ